VTKRSNNLKPTLCAICMILVALVTLIASTTGASSYELLKDSTPYVPDPSECTIEPIPVPSAPSDAIAIASPTSELPPPGPLVTNDVVVEITAVVVGAIACTNAGDTLRAFSYFTDDYVEQMFSGPDGVDYEGFIQYLSMPVTALDEGNRLEIVDISEVRQHRTGIVSATVVTRNSADTFEDFVIFVDVDGTWLIAGSRPVETVYATPSP
jgi:hypothetical protein